jgi:hypothetical protein
MKAAIIIAVLAFIGAFFYFRGIPATINLSSSLFGTSATSTDFGLVPELTQSYTDQKLQFSFQYPEGYSVREVAGEDDARTLLVENGTAKSGIQIFISPNTEETSITPEIIARDIPDMKVESPQQFKVGSNEGLAFKSDNPAFDGGSREVWFVFNRHLIQISTYADNDKLLAAIFKTWKL